MQGWGSGSLGTWGPGHGSGMLGSQLSWELMRGLWSYFLGTLWVPGTAPSPAGVLGSAAAAPHAAPGGREGDGDGDVDRDGEPHAP